MLQITRFVLRHKRAVAIGWIVATLIGMAAAGPASKALDQRFSVPGREGWETSQEIVRVYGNGGENLPFVPVVSLPAGTTVESAGVQEQLLEVEDAARHAVPGSRVAGFGSTGDAAFTSEDGRTSFVYVFPKRSDDPFGGNVEAVRKLEESLAGTKVGGARVRVTGYDALYDSTGEGADGPGVLIEAVIGGFGALLVLVFVFGSWLALVPLAMAICSVLVSFLLLWALTALTEVSPVVQFLVALVGLGISIDYALIIVVRWRE
jgi:RND superfamily putative drug exporter